MKKFSINPIWLIFLFMTLSISIMAQSEKCSVKLTVTKVNSEIEIKGATATAINDETKRVYKSLLRAGKPTFTNLPVGKYRITVTKAGYYRSADDFWLDCSEDDNDWSIELYTGNPKLVVKLYERNRNYVVGMANPDLSNVGQTRPDVPQTDDLEPVPTPTPTPKRTPPPLPKTIVGGVVNGKSVKLVKPEYPAAARAVRASGAVNVQVTIDEEGNVISAKAVSGHPLLRAAAVKAARESKFTPTMLSGQPVKVVGIIVYNFNP